MPAMAESRMAGSVHVREDSNKQTANHKTLEKNDSTGTQNINFSRLESYGVLTNSQDGSLGRDLWHGTKRSLILTYLPQLPSLSQYRTLQNLSKRLLLTKADARLIKQDQKPVPGNEITTLRIEKLLEMGAHKEALTLYTKYPGQAYHERFARAGILAAFYSKQPSLACLETKTIEDRFKDVSFWQQTSKICTYILSNEKTNQAKTLDFPQSNILQQIVRKKTYRFKIKKIEGLKELTPLETAVLSAENRFDFSRLKIGSTAEKLPQHVLALLLDEPSIKKSQAFTLMIKAAEQGLASRQDLAEYYQTKADKYFGKNNKQKTSLADYKAIKSWKKLPYLYRATASAAKGEEQTAIVKKALELAEKYGTAALWPFAEIIAGTNPKNLDSELIRYGLNILIETGIKNHPAWHNNQVKEKDATAKDILQSLAYGLENDPAPNNNTQAVDFKVNLDILNEHQQQLIIIIYENLDSYGNLSDYVASEAYEKHSGLTQTVDYVMQYAGLLDNLDTAKHEQRLGEVILLSSIALRDAPPDEIYAGLFREVIDGLVNVGLTEEARSLAREIILGLSIKK